MWPSLETLEAEESKQHRARMAPWHMQSGLSAGLAGHIFSATWKTLGPQTPVSLVFFFF